MLGVVVPIRSFCGAKARLASVLDDERRRELAAALATRVVDAARATGPAEIVVVSSAPEVHDWAAARAVTTIADPGTLDAAAHAGCDTLRSAGVHRIVVAHADLPHVTSFAAVTDGVADDEVVIVPCQRNDGTPVLSLPVGADFRFAYGPGSAGRHAATAVGLGLRVRVVRDAQLGFDIDVPDDLAASGLLAARP